MQGYDPRAVSGSDRSGAQRIPGIVIPDFAKLRVSPVCGFSESMEKGLAVSRKSQYNGIFPDKE